MSEELVKQAVSYAIAETRKIVAEEYEAAMEQMAEEMTRKAADTIEAQAAEIKRLREAGTKLAGFAEHDFGCLHYERNDSCDCGYTQAWKAWNAGLGETK